MLFCLLLPFVISCFNLLGKVHINTYEGKYKTNASLPTCMSLKGNTFMAVDPSGDIRIHLHIVTSFLTPLI